MKRYFSQIVTKGCFIILIVLQLSCTSNNSLVIFTSPDASKQEDLAAKEVRRYIYQRTGQLIPIINNKNDIAPFQSAIIITTCGSDFYGTVCPSEVKDEVRELKREGCYVKTIGNGTLGAMVYGGIKQEKFQLNENTLYSGELGHRYVKIDVTKSLERVRFVHDSANLYLTRVC